MAQKGTQSMTDYLNDYERAWQDYQEMGPLWAEMVFGDDFEAMKALYGRAGQIENNPAQTTYERDASASKRR